MEKNNETRNVPLWKLKEIANTLRLVSYTLNSQERESCLDRNIMRSWNDIVDIIKEKDSSSSERLNYYMKHGQIPHMEK